MMKTFMRLAACAVTLTILGCVSHPPVPGAAAERERAATLALLCADVLDLRRLEIANPGVPPAPPRWSHFAPAEQGGTWEIVGTVTGEDEMDLFGHLPVVQPRRVLFGVLAVETAHPERRVLVVRGTITPLEWGKDLEMALDATEWGDKVFAHHGFLSLYRSLRYQPKDGPADPRPAWQAIAEATQGQPLTIVGHSLGAALATFMTLDVASRRDKVDGRFLASPRPGNDELANAVARRVGDYLVFNNELDLVPRLPPLAASYRPLRNVELLAPANAVLRIDEDRLCHHQSIVYAALLNPTIMTVEGWQQRLQFSDKPRKCIGAAF